MKKIIVFVLILFSSVLYGQNSGKLEGELFFGFWRVGSFYDQPDSLISIMKNSMDTLDRNNVKEIDREFVKGYDLLKKEKLLYSPYVQLRIQNDSLIYLYLKHSDYDRIKIYKRETLINDNKKLIVVFKYRRIIKNRLVCKKILKIYTVDGKTSSRSGKFKIEDYD